jgi:hypothetical protein
MIRGGAGFQDILKRKLTLRNARCQLRDFGTHRTLALRLRSAAPLGSTLLAHLSVLSIGSPRNC